MKHTVVSAIAMLLAVVTLQADAQTSFKDDFNGLAMKSGWQWMREDVSSWQLTGSQLQITTQKGALNETQYNNVKNMLLRAPLDTCILIETKLTFYPNNMYHNAGLLYYIDDDNYIRVSRGWSDFTNGVWFEYEVGGKVTFEFNPNVVENVVFLRLERNIDKSGRSMYWSTWSIDSLNWDYIAFAKELHYPLTNVRVGLQAANGDGQFATSERIPALFDYFYMEVLKPTPVEAVPAASAAAPEILSIAPQPVRSGVTSVTYTATGMGDVTVSVFDPLGREVRSHVVNGRAAGVNSISLNTAGLPSGSYRVVVRSAQGIASRPIVIVR